ncbi:Sidoreflexin [Aphelenchoides bicaudatus]|nr:Sidoreflexin [Aphelenchoides bicaudatus]
MSSDLIRELTTRPDLTKPRWDQSTFEGRLRHFFAVTNPLNLLATNKELEESKQIIEEYRKGKLHRSDLTVEELWKAQHLYDSAFHPETGEKQVLVGRMSAQVPANMVLTVGLLNFHSRKSSVIFWQWLNQTFNAVVNYTNRSGEHVAERDQLFQAYCCATGGATACALYLNLLAPKLPRLFKRLVPFWAIAVSNLINIPMMRSKEFTEGIVLEDEHEQKVGSSRKVVPHAIFQVIISRIAMEIPDLVFIPLVINVLERKYWFRSRPWLNVLTQSTMCGFLLSFATPSCCALFPQMVAVKVENLEPEVRREIEARPIPPKIVYYNKGL